MMFLRSIFNYFVKEKAVFVMLLVLSAALLSVRVGQDGTQQETAPQEDIYSQESRLETSQKIQELSDRMADELTENPELVMISLVISLLVLCGILLDVILVLFCRDWINRRMQLNPERSVPWGLGDVFKVFVILFFAEFVLSVFIGVVLGISGVDLENPALILMSSTFFRSVIVFLYICYLTRKTYAVPLKNLGLTASRFLRQVGIGLGAYVAMIPVYLLVLLVITQVIQFFDYQPPVQTPVQILYKEDNPQLLLIFGLFMGLVGPFFEEVLFRGFMYQAIKARSGIFWGMVITSLFFAVLHAHWVALLPIFVLGLILNILFEKTGSIIPGVVMHMTHNTAMLLLTLQLKNFIV